MGDARGCEPFGLYNNRVFDRIGIGLIWLVILLEGVSKNVVIA